jgi:hypothetical protein
MRISQLNVCVLTPLGHLVDCFDWIRSRGLKRVKIDELVNFPKMEDTKVVKEVVSTSIAPPIFKRLWGLKH